MVRGGKPQGFFYLDHCTVDGRCGIVTDTQVTPANVHDGIPYLARLDRQRIRFGLEDRQILGVTGYRRPPPPREGMMPKKGLHL